MRRRSAPKSRGGCNTCKRRHIRCDGGVPECVECRKACRVCEYSAEPIRPSPEQLKVVLWRANHSILRQISPGPLREPSTVHAFGHFHENVAARLGGFFQDDFWRWVVLQVAYNAPAVRYAIIALSSLCEHKSRVESKSKSGSTSAEKSLIQYNHAISLLKRELEDGKSSIEATLTASVLFVSFEMLNGNTEVALRHISGGLFIFHDWEATPDDKGTQAGQSKSSTRNELYGHFRDVFQRLMLQLLLFPDSTGMDARLFDPNFTPAMPAFPCVFNTLSDARDCLHTCLVSMVHGSLAQTIQKSEASLRIIEEMQSRPSWQMSTGPLQSWSKSFSDFLESSKLSFGEDESRAAMMLQMQYIAGYILASVGGSCQETAFDSYDREFERIIYLGSQVFRNMNTQSTHALSAFGGFDIGVIPALYLTATRCRHHSLRHKALALLRCRPIQEGVWQGQMLACLAERLVTLEESGNETSTEIPARSRIRVLNTTINSMDRTIAAKLCWGSQDKPEVFFQLVTY